jgi:hypothetical protein
MINVYPINDLEEHDLDSTCKCMPTIKEEYGQMIVVHNSFDCREAVEVAKEIIKQQDKQMIDRAHHAITRIKGKDYAPNVHEIQEWIDKQQDK